MSGPVPVTKMSGAGNDFVVLGPEGIALVGRDLSAWTRRVCRRGVSIGADGVLVVEPGRDGRIRVTFRNPDGEEAFCGNGSRCAARYALTRGMAGPTMTLDTAAGEVEAEIEGVRVRLTLPPPRDLGHWKGSVGDEPLSGRRILAGVPHLILHVDDLDRAPLARWGPPLRRHPDFGPPGTNVDLVQWRDDGALSVRTWERGVEGETLACGSGAVAAALWACLEGAGEDVRIRPASGIELRVTLGAVAHLAGDARFVFEGTVTDEAVTGFA
jgi:diaminopimelate epimerase